MKAMHCAVAVLVVAALVLVAVPQPTSAQGEKVSLRITAIGGIVAEAVQALTAKYMEEHPDVTITVDIQTDDMSWQKTAPSTMFAVPDGPDLSWWWCSRTTQYNDMVDAGLLEPLDDLYASEGWDAAFAKGTLDYYTDSDGHRYGVNLDAVWTPMVYYNKDIFDEVGITPPTTWDEFYALADKLHAAGYETLSTPYEMGVRSHLPDGMMLRSWSEEEYNAFLVNWMPDAPEDALQHKWTDPNGLRIYQTIMDMADKGILMTGFTGITDLNQARSLFLSEKVAMFQDGSWSTGKTSMPTDATFNWGYFYYPLMDHENYGDMGSYVANCMIVFKDRPNVAAAKDVVKYILQPENMVVWAEKLGGPPGRTDLDPQAVEQALGPVMAGMLQEIKAAGAPPLYESVVPPELLASLKETIDLMLTGSMTPEEAAAAQQEATDKMRESLME